MELVVIGVGIWIALVVLSIGMCRVAGRADARTDGLYAGQRLAVSDDVARGGTGIRIPVL
jgi:hypothetical protein